MTYGNAEAHGNNDAKTSANGLGGRLSRFIGIAAVFAVALFALGSISVGASSTYGFSGFTNFFNHFKGHYLPPTCGVGGYGYSCNTTTTVSPSCSGTPSVSLAPNPTTDTKNVNVVVSGLSNCNGQTVDIDSYKGCSQGDILTSFASGLTGGSVIITPAPLSGGYGQKPSGSYGYYACVNNKASQSSEATLVVSAPATTTIPYHFHFP